MDDHSHTSEESDDENFSQVLTLTTTITQIETNQNPPEEVIINTLATDNQSHASDETNDENLPEMSNLTIKPNQVETNQTETNQTETNQTETNQTETNQNQQEYNLLILGETGVGKSTFINGFINYLTFETLNEAQNHPDLLSLIESSFVVTDPETMEQKTIKTGDSENENFAVGQSSTQLSKVYRFQVGEYVLRIIDTPGVGDVRGIQQDTENFQNILSTISNLDYLHGILILLKPNNSRINVMFRFCIQELLTHLHKSAIGNIIFGFTNSRGTFYAPGDTMGPLKALLHADQNLMIPLTKETIYCFDSESFRFLAASKQGVNFDDATTAAFSDSWNRSVKETHRLFQHVIEMPPHAVHDTTSINSARNLIIRLTKPLAEVTRLIDVNKKLCEDKIVELQTTKKHGKQLDEALLVPKIDLEPRKLGYPRTVCTNTSCIEVRDWEGLKKVNYITHCHEHCGLRGVQVDTLNTPRLMECTAMHGGQTCGKCGHGYQEHMHVVFELIQVSKTVEDENIKSQIDHYATDAQKKESFIAQLKNRIQEYEDEHAQVEKAAAEFGCFLKHNAIIPYSDARIEYLDHLLKEERAKAQVSGDDSIVLSMEETKQMYLEEFQIIDKAVASGENAQILDPKNVAKVEEKLYKLKHFGKTLRKVRDAGVTAHKVNYKEIPFKAPKGKKLSWAKYLFNTAKLNFRS